MGGLRISLFFRLIYTSTLSLSSDTSDLKKASDPITDGCEPPCGCWELNSGPLDEQQSVLLTTEPSLQLPNSNFYIGEMQVLALTAHILKLE